MKSPAPKSIAKALEIGIVTRYEKIKDFNKGVIYMFYVKFKAPLRYSNGAPKHGDWYECSERYFLSFVKKHRNFEAYKEYSLATTI